MTINDIPLEDKLAVEERAAILEYDAGMPRVNAEYAAVMEWQKARVVLCLRGLTRDATKQPCASRDQPSSDGSSSTT